MGLWEKKILIKIRYVAAETADIKIGS